MENSPNIQMQLSVRFRETGCQTGIKVGGESALVKEQLH